MTQQKVLADLVSRMEFFTSDSRKAKGPCIFLALKGETFDGHSFVKDLLEKDAQLRAVVGLDFYNSHSSFDFAKRLIPVNDTHVAHRELALEFRKKSKALVIAVGGSAGKTSTKEFLRQILSPHFRMVVTEKSQNGELGIPKTLEGLRPDTQIALIEVGIDRPDDMERHLSIVQPDLGVLTSIGEEHLEQLKDVDTVFREESKLFERTWERGGTCFAPKADSYLARHGSKPRTLLTPENPIDINASWKTNLHHPLALRNAALAAKVADFLGLSGDKIATALSHLELPEGRGRFWTNAKGQLIIADHYNSNPASLRAGYLYLKTLDPKDALYLILGDMLELGPNSGAYHKDLLLEALDLTPQGICLVGPQFAAALSEIRSENEVEVISVPTSLEAKQRLLSWKDKQGNFFFKGSRGMRLENVLELFS